MGGGPGRFCSHSRAVTLVELMLFQWKKKKGTKTFSHTHKRGISSGSVLHNHFLTFVFRKALRHQLTPGCEGLSGKNLQDLQAASVSRSLTSYS